MTMLRLVTISVLLRLCFVAADPTPNHSTAPSQVPLIPWGDRFVGPFYISITVPSVEGLTQVALANFVGAAQVYIDEKLGALYGPTYQSCRLNLANTRIFQHYPVPSSNVVMIEFHHIFIEFGNLSADDPLPPTGPESFQDLKEALNASPSQSLDVVRQQGIGTLFENATAVVLREISEVGAATGNCTCSGVTTVADSLADAESAVRVWLQWDSTASLKATDGYLYYQATATKWFKQPGYKHDIGQIVLKTHSSTGGPECGRPFLQTKTYYIVFGIVSVEKVPGYAGPTTVLTFDSCTGPVLTAELTHAEWRTIYENI